MPRRDASGAKLHAPGESVWIRLVAFAFLLFFLVTAFYPIADHVALGLFTLICWALAFLLFEPAGVARLRKKNAPWHDWILVLLSLITCAYFVLRYEVMTVNIGILNDTDRLVMGVAILLALEAGRRTIGLAISITAMALIGYCLYVGFSVDQVLTRAYLGEIGIYGTIADIFVRYILFFIVFGTLLERAGAIKLLNSFVVTVAQKTPGGAAKAAVMGSAVMGGIVGSSGANVAVTGIVTIPMMIEQRFKRHRAAAIEAAAGLGGEISPPIMGAAAFVLVANTGINYRDLMLIAIIPAILYYLFLYFSIDLESRRDGALLGSASSDAAAATGSVWPYLHLLVAPAVLVAIVLIGYSPTFAGASGIVAAVVVAQLRKSTRMSGRKIFEALADGVLAFLPLGATAAALGLIMVAMVLSGLPNEFAGWAMGLTKASLPLLIVAVLVMGLVLGLGLPIIASYMILATVCGPGLDAFGIPVVAAHLLMLWYVQIAAVTPPSALAAQIAANIAGAGFYETCFACMWSCIPFYIVPLWFIYASLVTGDWTTRIGLGLVVAFGLFFLAVASARFLLGRLSAGQTAIAWIVALLLLIPYLPFNYAGMALGVAFFIFRGARAKSIRLRESAA